MPAQSEMPVVRVKKYMPPRKRWTRAEYDHLVNIGFFTPNDKIELLEGELVRKMTVNPPHASGISLMQDALLPLFSVGHIIRIQLPLALGTRSEPEPDLAVVTGRTRDYLAAHPTTAVLVIEVSDSTLRVDRTTKASIYARAGIAEYVMLNLVDRTLDVHRSPGPMRGRPLGYGYNEKTVLASGAVWKPLAAPEAEIAVADVLP